MLICIPADPALAGAVALGVGGELVDASALRAGKPEIVAETARRFVACVQQARAQLRSAGAAAGR